MSQPPTPPAPPPAPTGSAASNGVLWGRRARDWAELQEGQVAPAYAAAFDHAGVGPGTRLLDAGCGSGMALAQAETRGARASGIDASASLLAIARERTRSADLREGDLEALPFTDDSFDVVTGFNSFQYAADAVAALREAGRVCRPGGSVVVVTWGPPEGMGAAELVLALRPLLPPPPSGAPGPFALSDPDRLAAFAASAGLTPARTFTVACDWTYADEARAVRGLNSSGVAARAIAAAGEAAVSQAHAEAIRPFRTGAGGYRIPARFLGVVATA